MYDIERTHDPRGSTAPTRIFSNTKFKSPNNRLEEKRLNSEETRLVKTEQLPWSFALRLPFDPDSDG